MGRKSKKRRFYPEFYSDDEYKELISQRGEINQNDVHRRADVPLSEDVPHPAAEPDAEGAEEGRKTGYSEQELTYIYSRLKGTESGADGLSVPRRANVPQRVDIALENFKREFIEENKKFSPFSPENPLKGIEIYPDEGNPESDLSEPRRTEQSVLESEPENGGYIQYNGEQNSAVETISFGRADTQETFNELVDEIINEEEYESVMEETMTFYNSDTANEPEEIAVFNDDYIDPDAFSEDDDYEETMAYTDPYPLERDMEEVEEYGNPEAMDTFSDHYIAPGETFEPEASEEPADSEEPAASLETMERVASPIMDVIPPVTFSPPIIVEEHTSNQAPIETNISEYIIPNNQPDTYPLGENNIKPYDREAAVKYAHRWALDRNPAYYDYDEIGGDCTNYASQVLLAGGCAMDFTPNTGWYYKSGNLKSPSWTGVEYLYNFLVGEKVAGLMGREVDISEVQPGDLVNLSFNGKTYQHCPVIVKVKKTGGDVSPKDILICAHSYDCENRPLDTYTWKKMRFIKIVGTK